MLLLPNKQNIIITHNLIITISLLKKKQVIFNIITPFGIFWRQMTPTFLTILNLKKNILIKSVSHIKKPTISILSQLLNITYSSYFLERQYLKLKGLGFSIKYLLKPQHFVLLQLGLSKALYLPLPMFVSIIRKPRKKKYVLTLFSPQNALIVHFMLFIQKLKYPDPYKLKGIRFLSEYFKLKEGKKKK